MKRVYDRKRPSKRVVAAVASVLQFRQGATDAEGMLRDALSQCGEARSRSKEPYLVILMGENGRLPEIGITEMLTTDLVTCAARLQLAAAERLREEYEDGENG